MTHGQLWVSWGPNGHPGSFPDSPWCLSCRLGVAAQQQSQPCLQRTPQASRCTIPHVHLFSTVPYLLNVTVVHPGGTNSSLLAFVAERISECLSSLPLSNLSIPQLILPPTPKHLPILLGPCSLLPLDLPHRPPAAGPTPQAPSCPRALALLPSLDFLGRCSSVSSSVRSPPKYAIKHKQQLQLRENESRGAVQVFNPRGGQISENSRPA